MDKIEKIRAEIERRITDNAFGAKLELIDILAWLDSLQQEQQEEPDKSLEDAAKEYVKDIPTFKDSCLMKAAFEDGWLCSKQQMLKDAVEGIIYQPVEYYWAQIIAQYDGELKNGDKVRIIIVEEDEK